MAFDLFGHNFMTFSLVLTTYFSWLYGYFYGILSIAASTLIHALILQAAGKTSLTVLFSQYPILYFGVLTQIIMVFLIHFFKTIYNQLKNAKTEIEIAKLRAENSDRAKAAFMADLSHEIRNPLCSIIGYAELLNEDTALTQTQKETLAPILSNANHILALTNKVLDFSKIENEQITIENSELNITSLIAEICSANRYIAIKKGLEFEQKLKGKFDNYLICDPLRLKQILINLINNAIKFTETGKVVIECEELSVEGSYSKILFKVSDTGKGLTSQEIDNIFKPYKQANSAIERKYGGTGLGLAIANKLVGLMSGEPIKVTSEIGQGTVFSFSVRLKKGAVMEKQSKAESKKSDKCAEAQKLKILVVEDNLFNITYIKTVLEAKGHEVMEATDGLKALGIALNNDVDFMLIDLQIPEINGIEVTKKLRAEQKTMPIICITGSLSNGVIEECTDAGMNGCLAKPFRPEEIYQIIEKFAN